LEARPLLNVQLEICRELGRIAPRRRGVSTLTERAQGLGDRHTIPVATIPDAGREATEHRRGPEEAHTEPRTLLIGPRHDLDRAAQAHVRIDERLDRLDRAEDAKRAVEPAAFRYRVQMRPHENDLAFAAESREEIRGGVAPHLCASFG